MNCFWLFKYGNVHFTTTNAKGYHAYSEKFNVFYESQQKAEDAWVTKVLGLLHPTKPKSYLHGLAAFYHHVLSGIVSCIPDFPAQVEFYNQSRNSLVGPTALLLKDHLTVHMFSTHSPSLIEQFAMIPFHALWIVSRLLNQRYKTCHIYMHIHHTHTQTCTIV